MPTTVESTAMRAGSADAPPPPPYTTALDGGGSASTAREVTIRPHWLAWSTSDQVKGAFPGICSSHCDGGPEAPVCWAASTAARSSGRSTSCSDFRVLGNSTAAVMVSGRWVPTGVVVWPIRSPESARKAVVAAIWPGAVGQLPWSSTTMPCVSGSAASKACTSVASTPVAVLVVTPPLDMGSSRTPAGSACRSCSASGSLARACSSAVGDGLAPSSAGMSEPSPGFGAWLTRQPS